jgi:hypothetical protein
MHINKITTQVLNDLMGKNKPAFLGVLGKAYTEGIRMSILDVGTVTKCNNYKAMQDAGLIKVFLVNPNWAYPAYIAVSAKDAGTIAAMYDNDTVREQHLALDTDGLVDFQTC